MILILFILPFPLIYLFHHFTKKYLNPYKLIFVFGKKGSGKSTMLERLMDEHHHKGWSVYSTEVPKTDKRYVNPRKIYDRHFPPKSAIFIDEVSLIWDNRDFKNMDKRVIEWFRYQRHHKCRVYLFSQTFDIDKKLRDLADEMYLVKRYFRLLVIGRRIIRKPVVVHPSAEAPARIDEDLVVDGPLMWLFGGLKLAWLPKWAKRYDSFKAPESCNAGAARLASTPRPPAD